MSFNSTKKNWEGLAQKDPYWAVCTHSDKLGNKWDQDEFFLTGKRELDIIMNQLTQSEKISINRKRALDFGCGLGRLTRRLLTYFDKVDGVDVSQTMIQKAKELHSGEEWSNIYFHHNELPNLSLFDDHTFSFVYTTIVLQHIPYPESGKYITEFLRILEKDGVLVFQVPVKDIRILSLGQKIKSRLKIKERLALVGIGDGYNMQMNPIPEQTIMEILKNNDGELINTYYTNHTDPSFNGEIEFVNKEKSQNFISALFMVKKSS